MTKSAMLAVAIALSLSGSLYAAENETTGDTHIGAMSDAHASSVTGSQEAWFAVGGAEPALTDIKLAAEALAGQLTDEEAIIDVQSDADGHAWAVVLGGYCHSDSDCVQYTRKLSLDETDDEAGNSGNLEGRTAESSKAQMIDLSIVPMALPSVHMANVVVQAQVEPFRGNQRGLAGDGDVRQVQQGLVAKGISTTVDGWYGNGTTAAYATWQRRLGYSGLDATGVPGPSSLAALGQSRYVLTNRISVGSRTTFTGKRVNERTRAMLLAAQRLFGRSISLTQGSYNAGGVGASAGTHDGGGAVDVNVSGLTESQRLRLVKALRTVGFAAWYRQPSQGPWGYHIHAVAVGDTDVSLQARDQVADYYVGKNGLASHAGDDTPTQYRAPFTWWERYHGY